jgi:tetratricopeptide (TPR) repeat protein
VKRFQSAVYLLALLVVGLGTYANSLQGGYFILDDEPSIESNFDIRQILPLWREADRTSNPPVNNRPVVRLSLALNYAYGEFQVRGYRAVNLGVHLFCALLLFIVVRNTLLSSAFAGRYLTTAEGLAFAIALIWLVHPLQTQCVNHTIQRSTSLMAFFYLLTIWCVQVGREKLAWHVLAVGACGLGMASKEAMVTAPIAVLLYDRTFLAGSFRKAWKIRWRLYLGLAGSWFFLAFLLRSSPHGKSINLSEPYIAWHYALNQTRIILEHYLATLFWPASLTNFYGPIRYVQWIDLWGYVLVVLVLLVATAYALIRRPTVGFPAAWFFLLLAPTSTVAAIFWEAMAERRPYLAQAGIIGLVVVWCHGRIKDQVARGMLSLRAVQWICRGSLGFVVAVFISLTVERNRAYQDLEVLWGAEIEYVEEVVSQLQVVLPKVSYHRAELYIRLGLVFADAGDWQRAEENYKQALLVHPGHFGAHKWLGHMYKELEQADLAIYHFRQAIALNPQAYNAHNALGALLCMRGEVAEGIGHLRAAVDIFPNYVWAHSNLGAALRMSGDEVAARKEFRRALMIAPEFGPARENLAAMDG